MIPRLSSDTLQGEQPPAPKTPRLLSMSQHEPSYKTAVTDVTGTSNEVALAGNSMEPEALYRASPSFQMWKIESLTRSSAEGTSHTDSTYEPAARSVTASQLGVPFCSCNVS